MAPFLLALLLLAQDAATADGPVATAVPRQQPAATPPPIQGGPVTPPTDDYGYVAWCYGAVDGYLALYDRAMPEVIRIERAWPTPSTEDNIAVVYPSLRDEARSSLKLFRRSMEAAERASPTPIQPQGVAAIRKGAGVWVGANSVSKALLAQFWMSWSPPARCEETAKTLEARSNLFGQALSFNSRPAAAPPATPTTPPTEPGPEPRPEPTVSLTGQIGLSAPHDAAADLVSSGLAAEAAPLAETPAPSARDAVAVTDTPPPPAPAILITDPAPPAGEPAGPEPSAIDALLPAPVQPAAPVAETPMSEASPQAVAAPPLAAAPTPPPLAKPRTARKRGLRETLTGARSPQ